MTKKQLREVNRGEKEKAQGCDVRPAADVRPVVLNLPDVLVDVIAERFGRRSESPSPTEKQKNCADCGHGWGYHAAVGCSVIVGSDGNLEDVRCRCRSKREQAAGGAPPAEGQERRVLSADEFEHLALMGMTQDGTITLGDGAAERVLEHAKRLAASPASAPVLRGAGEPDISAVLAASDEAVGPACSNVKVPPTIAVDESFREPYAQGYRHALTDVRATLSRPAPASSVERAVEVLAPIAAALLRSTGSQEPTADDYPLLVCPKCGVSDNDFDGFGFIACESCGYCTHPSRDGGTCSICGDQEPRREAPDTLLAYRTVLRQRDAALEEIRKLKGLEAVAEILMEGSRETEPRERPRDDSRSE